MTQREAFERDLSKMNAMFEHIGAIVTDETGWKGVDPTKAPAAAVEAYGRLVSMGYANRLDLEHTQISPRH